MADLFENDLDRVLSRTRDLWEDLRGQRLFITGATGFFGCWIMETFAWANRRLNLKARATILTRHPETLRSRAPHLAGCSFIDPLVGDVRSFPFPPGQYSHIIHGATESSTVIDSQQPLVMFDTIVEGTRRCVEFALEAKAKRLLLVSSGAVYGVIPSDMTHVTEEFMGGPNPLDPRSAYGEGKRAAELLCAMASSENGLQPTIARCFAFVGPYMNLHAHFAIGNFIRDQMNGGPIRILGDGTPLRSYMYSSDLMIWLWTILLRGQAGTAYNVGSEQALSVADVAQEVARTLSPEVKIEVLGVRRPGVPPETYVPSTARARQELGLECYIPLHEAIKRTREWFHHT
jgi:dTDP-glucose 4,6-dehydratase